MSSTDPVYSVRIGGTGWRMPLETTVEADVVHIGSFPSHKYDAAVANFRREFGVPSGAPAFDLSKAGFILDFGHFVQTDYRASASSPTPDDSFRQSGGSGGVERIVAITVFETAVIATVLDKDGSYLAHVCLPLPCRSLP